MVIIFPTFCRYFLFNKLIYVLECCATAENRSLKIIVDHLACIDENHAIQINLQMKLYVYIITSPKMLSRRHMDMTNLQTMFHHSNQMFRCSCGPSTSKLSERFSYNC